MDRKQREAANMLESCDAFVVQEAMRVLNCTPEMLIFNGIKHLLDDLELHGRRDLAQAICGNREAVEQVAHRAIRYEERKHSEPVKAEVRPEHPLTDLHAEYIRQEQEFVNNQGCLGWLTRWVRK